MFAKINGFFLVTYCSRAANLKAMDQKYTPRELICTWSSLLPLGAKNGESLIAVIPKQTFPFSSNKQAASYLFAIYIPPVRV